MGCQPKCDVTYIPTVFIGIEYYYVRLNILSYYAMIQFFSNLPIMLSDFPIMLHGFTYYAQILNAGALQMMV